jgi:2-dehydro-3-deoxygluconokinase
VTRSTPDAGALDAVTLDAVTLGEVMVMFVAQEAGPLESVEAFRRALAGAETNVAIGLARLGHRAGWIGRVGDDPFGRYALAELADAGVDTSAVSVDPQYPTAFQLKSMAAGRDPEVVYFRRNSAGSRLAPSPDAEAYIRAARHLHITGIPLALSPTTRTFTFRAVEAARSAGLSISFDPNLRPALWGSSAEMVAVVNALAERADWVLPGVDEGRILTGARDPRGIAGFYLDRGVQRVVVKHGAEGATLFTAEEQRGRPVFPVEVVDTVGAGDGFAAGLISGHLDGLDVVDALERAAAVGALATTSPGDKDGLPTRAELDAFLAEHRVHGGEAAAPADAADPAEPADSADSADPADAGRAHAPLAM